MQLTRPSSSCGRMCASVGMYKKYKQRVWEKNLENLSYCLRAVERNRTEIQFRNGNEELALHIIVVASVLN